MEALKEFDIVELLRRQGILDKKFDEKETVRKRTMLGVRIALFTELGELFQELKGEWCYWKNSTEPINKERVLEELSDCLHFYLSYVNLAIKNGFLKEKKVNKWTLDTLSTTYVLEDLIDFLLFDVSDFMNNKRFAEYPIIRMFEILNPLGVTMEEFLEVHHKVWLRNMGERVKVEY